METSAKPTQDFVECGAIEACGPGSCSYPFHQREVEPNEAKNEGKEESVLPFHTQECSS